MLVRTKCFQVSIVLRRFHRGVQEVLLNCVLGICVKIKVDFDRRLSVQLLASRTEMPSVCISRLSFVLIQAKNSFVDLNVSVETI